MDAVGLPVGTRVKLRPRAGGDVFDLALVGKTAVVDVVERDMEGRVHVGVLVDDDPGRDLGERGHRFFFAPEEVVPLRVLVAGIGNVFLGDDAMLSAPIILEDHPRIAPESPGDLFDGGEIDGLLALNIMALTDDEKAAMRVDPRTRAILERTEALTEEQLWTLSGYRLERG